MKSKCAVFDFDNTIKLIPKDFPKDSSKFYSGKESLLPENEQRRLQTIRKEKSWDEFTIASIQAVNQAGLTKESIVEAVKEKHAFVPHMEEVIEKLYHDHDIVIISDTHTFNIDIFLEKFGLSDKVSAFYGQPAEISDNGQIILENVPEEYNNCKDGGRNLCKGSAMKHFTRGKNYQQIKYFGDGKNDLCPALMLNEEDMVFPRLNFKLVELLKSGNHQVKAQVQPWNDGADILALI